MPAQGTPSNDGRIGRRLILWLPLTYVLISGLILLALLVQLHRQAMESGEQLIGSFARLANEQTSRTIQTTATTAQIIEARLNAPIPVTEPAFSNRLRESLASRPFIRSIWVLDSAGKVIHGAGGDFVTDHADRPYFRHYQANPQSGLEIFAPVRSRASNEWLIPVAKAWLRPDGSFAGVIVVNLDPRYFDRTWSLGEADRDRSVALLRRDGILLTRSPHDDAAMGRSFAEGMLFTRLLPASPVGTFRVEAAVDGRARLLGYHAVSEFPDLVIVVGHTVDHVLAGWHRTVFIVVIGWLAASAALGAMAVVLWREWGRRQQSEARYRLLFDANPHAMAVHDPQSLRFLAVNAAAVRQYGWTREEFLGMTLADIRPPQEVSRLRATVPRQIGEHRMRHWRKDGSVFEVEAVVTPITFDGRPAMLGLAQDVTERNVTRQRLDDAIRAFPGSFRLFDRDERLVLSNGVRWGTSQIELPPPPIGDTFESMARLAAEQELDVAAVGRREEWLRERLAQFRRGDTNVEVQWRDGRWFQLLERRTSDGGTISLRLDITARKAVEEQLRQSQKMDAIGQLTGGVAHDINNMLTVIIGNAEALLEQRSLEADARETLELMLRAAEGSAELTNRLLAFARRQPLRPKQLDVNGFIGRMEGLLRRSLGEQVEVVLARAADLWPVSIDPGQLETAILNLAINARDAMPGGGRLTIATGNAIVDASYATGRHDVAIGDYVVVSISDTGTGMTPQTLAHAFEPFFTTKDVGKGTGLGLSMVYGFVQQSGGHVTIHSEAGEGTTVRMYLPRASDADGAPGNGETQAPLSTARGETILLVEDDDLVRGHVVTQLRQLGYRVTPASDGRQALALLAGEEPVDLLFTDMVMPGGIGGRELAEQARRLRPGIRTLFTTGYSADAVARAGRLELDAPLLGKPYRLRELAERIREALDRR
ncbi:MAG: PAS domain S-box protein [Alphaproteobacteria bacterium]|nr:PAS domain S-box protein [Alphaproteobacteria bacterium]MCW5740604.1 PAS domain S-box protein [Alphaproteobacteria bacterium]